MSMNASTKDNPTTDNASGGPKVSAVVMAASPLLLMVEESHAEFLRERFALRASRHAARGAKSGDEKQGGPDAVAKFPNANMTGGYGYVVAADGVATVSIRGVLTPSAYAWFDDAETITDWLARDLLAMAADGDVKAVLLEIDSPGGYVSGSFELSDAIAAVAAVKPTATFAGGYCCSAAYLQAVQTGEITAYRTAIIGSIGTRSAVVDASRLFANFGVKMIPIDSGGMKSAGLIGTEITPEQIEYFRGTVMKLQEVFTGEFAKGRKMKIETAEQLADGRVHVAGEAQKLGLIDAVGSSAAARTRLLAKVGGMKSAGVKDGGKKKMEAAETVGEIILVQTAEGGDADGPTPQGAAADSQEGSDEQMSQPKDGAAPGQGKQEQQKEADRVITPAAATGASGSTGPVPATMADLEAAFSDDLKFAIGAYKEGLTIVEAKARYSDVLVAEKKLLAQENAELKKAKPVGSKALNDGRRGGGAQAGGGDGGGEPVSAFNDAVVEQQKRPGYENRKKAIPAVCRNQPDLHQAYLLATNPGKKQQAMIEGKFAASA